MLQCFLVMSKIMELNCEKPLNTFSYFLIFPFIVERNLGMVLCQVNGKNQKFFQFSLPYKVHFKHMKLVYQGLSENSLSIYAIIEYVLSHPHIHAQIRCRKNSIECFQHNAHKMHFKPLKSHVKR